jgi:hypothetical protein
MLVKLHCVQTPVYPMRKRKDIHIFFKRNFRFGTYLFIFQFFLHAKLKLNSILIATHTELPSKSESHQFLPTLQRSRTTALTKRKSYPPPCIQKAQSQISLVPKQSRRGSVSVRVSDGVVVAFAIVLAEVRRVGWSISLCVVRAGEDTVGTILVENICIKENAKSRSYTSCGMASIVCALLGACSGTDTRVVWLRLGEGLHAHIGAISCRCVDRGIAQRDGASEAWKRLRSGSIDIATSNHDLEVVLELAKVGRIGDGNGSAKE